MYSSYDLVALLREWFALEVVGHLGLVALRQLCGTWWSWQSGGPFAYWDVSRAMLLGDAFWVVAVVCASAIRRGLLTAWGGRLGHAWPFGAWAWLPWLVPGCALGWAVLIPGDAGAAYILALPAGIVFEGFHLLFFGYVFARLLIAAMQLVAAGGLSSSRRGLPAPQPAEWHRLLPGLGCGGGAGPRWAGGRAGAGGGGVAERWRRRG